MWEMVAAELGGAAIKGFFGSQAAKKAAKAQAAAVKEAIAATEKGIGEQKALYGQARAGLDPYRLGGNSSLKKLLVQLGIVNPTASKKIGAAWIKANYNKLNQPFTMDTFWNDPVTKASYQSGLDEGVQGVDRMMASRGMLNSGRTLKELTRFGTDYTGRMAEGSYNRFRGRQEDVFRRLMGLTGLGANSAAQEGSLGVQTGGNIGASYGNIADLITGGGNARGASAIAQGNAWGNAFGNAGSSISDYLALKNMGTGASPYATGTGGMGYGM